MTKKQVEGEDFRYQRTGKCQPDKCGSFCCTVGPLMMRISQKDRQGNKRFSSFFGWQEVGTLKDGDKIIAQRMQCRHLKKGRCSIYKKRPKVCKAFPAHPSQEWYKVARQHGCTYRFKRVPLKKKEQRKIPEEKREKTKGGD